MSHFSSAIFSVLQTMSGIFSAAIVNVVTFIIFISCDLFAFSVDVLLTLRLETAHIASPSKTTSETWRLTGISDEDYQNCSVCCTVCYSCAWEVVTDERWFGFNFCILHLYASTGYIENRLHGAFTCPSHCPVPSSSNMTLGQSSLISLAHHCCDWHPGNHCGWTYNQLTSKVDGGITGGQFSCSVRPHNLATGFRPPSSTVVSTEPFSHGTGTLRCM